jgi:glycosyltransferase involved in cell wall biosynthesis
MIGAAAERAASFARYLPQHGWQCHVLTAGRTGATSSDAGAAVHRVPDPLSPPESIVREYDPRRVPSRWRACLRELTFPDRFFRWRQAALSPAIELIRGHDIKLVLASFPPASAVDLALRACRRTGARLVLEFRDHWLGPGGYEPLLSLTRRRHARLERQAVTQATAVITISDPLAEAVREEHDYDPDRVLVIPNGYDPSATDEEPGFAAFHAAPRSHGDPVIIAHIGTVTSRNRPDLFFRSAASLQARNRLEGIVFKYVGNLSKDFVHDAGLAPIVQTTGLVPREQADQELHAANALLLLTGRYVGRWGHNAKLFEYIRSGRPILCLEEEAGSNDRRLLERFAAHRSFFGRVDDPDSVAGALEALRLHLQQAPKTSSPLDPAYQMYDRRNLVARLAGHLDELVGRKAV